MKWQDGKAGLRDWYPGGRLFLILKTSAEAGSRCKITFYGLFHY